MKLVTHAVFGGGVVVSLTSGTPFEVRLLVAFVLSVSVNLVIDGLGHTRHGKFVARSPVTHSIFSAPVWGAAVGYGIWAAGSAVGSLGADYTGLAYLGALVAVSHLALDLVTERGIYFTTGRIALAHFRSGNALLNALFLVLGVSLLLT